MSIGYPDWQKVSKRGFGQVGACTWTAGNFGDSLAIDVSLYSNLLLTAGTLDAGVVLCKVNWLSDSSLNDVVFTQQIPIGGGFDELSAIVLPCMSSWVELMGNPTEANYGGHVYAYATDRVLPSGGVPIHPIESLASNYSLAAGTAVTLTPSSYMSGLCNAWVLSTGGDVALRIWGYNDTLSAVRVYETTFTAGVDTNIQFAAPLGAWYAQFYNAGTAASDVYLTITPTT